MKCYLLILIICLSSCNHQNFEIEKLRAENDSLKKEILDFEQKQSIAYSKTIHEVTLTNTTVEELISKYNGQHYKIKIKFPQGYAEDKQKHYPVLYVIDAETNFGGISYIVQRLIKDKLIPEILVVGIAYGTDYHNFYKLRSRDLTPVEDKELKMGGKYISPTGGAPDFSNFLEFELFPFIAEKFRVDQGDRAIYGHSFGGLYGSYVFLDKPHLFNKYVLLSPSLWYKDNLLVEQAKNKNKQIYKTKLYLASGELEGRIDDLQIQFADIINKSQFEKLSLKSEVIENETHRTIFGVGFTNGIRFIYE